LVRNGICAIDEVKYFQACPDILQSPERVVASPFLLFAKQRGAKPDIDTDIGGCSASDLPAGSFSLKVPLSFVTMPVDFPNITIDTPGSGLSLLSITLPLINAVFFWAEHNVKSSENTSAVSILMR
jgi:hypothetical protein